MGRVVQLRATVEGLKLTPAVLQRLAAEGERTSLRYALDNTWPLALLIIARYALQLLSPAAILATLAGRAEIDVEDIGEMNELFIDAKTSAAKISTSTRDGYAEMLY